MGCCSSKKAKAPVTKESMPSHGIAGPQEQRNVWDKPESLPLPMQTPSPPPKETPKPEEVPLSLNNTEVEYEVKEELVSHQMVGRLVTLKELEQLQQAY